jgi:hypothetical protein
MTLSSNQRLILMATALFGLLGPNGVFLYFAMFRRQEFFAAMSNPITLAFIVEAFVVTGILTTFIARRFSGPWGWKTFLLLSLTGGLGFSIPFFVIINSQIVPAEQSKVQKST